MKVKSPPLLNLPRKEREETIEVSESDRKLMRDGLEHSRKIEDGWRIVEMHQWLREIGEKTQFTSTDYGAVQNVLAEPRRKKEGDTLAKMYFRLHELGENVKILNPDKRLMKRKLTELRDSGRAHLTDAFIEYQMHLKEIGLGQKFTDKDLKIAKTHLESIRSGMDPHQGYHLAKFHLFMNRLKQPQQVTEKDKKIILTQAKDYIRWSHGWGDQILKIHSLMDDLGIKNTISKEAMQKIREDLEMKRSDNNACDLAEMHYLLKKTQKPSEKTTSTPMLPPLKEVGR